MLKEQDRVAICDTIRAILNRNGITSLQIIDSNLKSIGHFPYIFFQPCPFERFFYKNHVTKMINLYAYKKAQRVYDMLVNNELHLTSLKLNEKNDSSEYSEAFLRLGYLYPFIASDYCSQQNKCPNAKNKTWFKGIAPIDNDRENIFIYCFTNEFNKKRHWFEYADEDRGVCVEYDLDVSKLIGIPGFYCGRIHYDTGYDFDFIKEIIHHVRVDHKKMFQPTGLTQMAMLYKRDKYKWEDESRLVFNLKTPSLFTPSVKDLIQSNSQWFDTTTKGVLKIKGPSNPHISWQIKRVICGSRIDPVIYKKIDTICKTQSIQCI
jgi:hypothetical protein